MKKSDIFWQTYLNLEKEIVEVSRFIFITDVKTVVKNGAETLESCNTQLETFSPHLADLLVRCCVQIEALSKELYHENGGTKPRGDSSIYFDEDCLKLIDIKWETHYKEVVVVAPYFNLTKDENRLLKPLKEAHKKQGTYWERAYQAVKHDRYSSLRFGNVKAVLHAMAALYLLNIYYRKNSWITKFNDINKIDYSMGSLLFSVRSPKVDQLWYHNTPVKSESPYVVSYKDEAFNTIQKMQQEENKALNEYWRSQPELQEPAFIAQLQRAFDEQKQGPAQHVMLMWELGEYRLNKKIPEDLPFLEKKSRLINSEEWRGWIHQNNNHLKAEELTEDNIQQEIKTVGRLWGLELEKKFQKMAWIPIAMNQENCKIYIPE